jgi:hypothetical protein
MECAGDDYWLPGKVALQISFMEEHPEYGMCYGKAMVKKNNKIIKALWGNEYCDTVSLFLKGNNIPAVSICMLNQLVRDYIYTIKPESKEWKSEDYPMWIYFSYQSKIFYLNAVLAVYRVHEKSITHIKDKENALNLSDSDFNLKYFLLEYTKTNLDPFLLIKQKIQGRLFLAIKYKDRKLALQYISETKDRNMKYLIEKCLINNPFLFYLLHLFQRCKRYKSIW